MEILCNWFVLSVALYIKDNPLIRETFCVVIFNKVYCLSLFFNALWYGNNCERLRSIFCLRGNKKLDTVKKVELQQRQETSIFFWKKNANWKCGICTVRSISNVACCKGLIFAFINVYYDSIIPHLSIYVINNHFPN